MGRLGALLLLAGCASGTPPVDAATVQMFLVCLLNCPIAVTTADEGVVTDTIPIEHAHILPENMRSYNERPVTPGKK